MNSLRISLWKALKHMLILGLSAGAVAVGTWLMDPTHAAELLKGVPNGALFVPLVQGLAVFVVDQIKHASVEQ